MLYAVTVHDPWPFAFLELGKDIENRGWIPSADRLRRGNTIALHAGSCQSVTKRVERNAQLFREMDRLRKTNGQLHFPETYDVRGIFALAIVDGFTNESDSPWFVGPIGWLLQDVFRLPVAVECPGKQGLWRVPEQLEYHILGACPPIYRRNGL